MSQTLTGTDVPLASTMLQQTESQVRNTATNVDSRMELRELMEKTKKLSPAQLQFNPNFQ